MSELVNTSRALSRAVSKLEFDHPVAYVYNPLAYARKPHEIYLRRFGEQQGRIVLVGMNPGPFGMTQTGVPFGDVASVRDWMGIEATVGRPSKEHPKRPVQGFACTRAEVSGSRLWGWARVRFGAAERFFAQFFVINYCPLVFIESTGRNRTPNKLSREERAALFPACDEALRRAIEVLRPTYVVGVGAWATQRSTVALGDRGPPIGTVLHPSPASPRANRGWAVQAEDDLLGLGIRL